MRLACSFLAEVGAVACLILARKQHGLGDNVCLRYAGSLADSAHHAQSCACIVQTQRRVGDGLGSLAVIRLCDFIRSLIPYCWNCAG